ncbi:MAG: NAD-dependent deacylase [Parvularculaceae bacterium]
MPRRIVILTGAGISAESGLSTFRDMDGVWARYDWCDVATPEAFARDPERVHEFYNWRRANLNGVEPNAAHEALGRLEQALGERLTLVTQNVDDLHERGGAARVIHMHGELRRVRCEQCGGVFAWSKDLGVKTPCPQCKNPQGLRPHVVWFGEIPFHLPEIAKAIAEADQFVSIGTSGSVYPAAGFVSEARALGIPCMELNLEPSENAQLFCDARYGRAAEIVPLWVDEILACADNS